jgi:ubiquinone/menaquinone biosynthesis C-methylase UbiE
MEHSSMVGTLAAQAEMIWPQERPLLERIGLPEARTVLDLGTGTGEAAGRIARTWPHLRVEGVDLFEGHLEVARRNHPPQAVPNLRFSQADARALPFPGGSFGAVVCRHVTHAIPDPDRVFGEAHRVLAPGGLLHLLAEDYAAVLIDAPDAGARDLYLEAVAGMRRRGTDLLHGRAAFRMLRAAGFEEVRAEALVLDPGNASRETFARMLRFWRDGYADLLASALGVAPAEVVRRFDAQVEAVLDPSRWWGWWLIALRGRKAR